MMDESSLTPLMRQYWSIKGENPDALLFFRLGDFYELFDEDARYVSRVLGITLTQRQGVAMCGVPHHASETYLNKLVELGCKVAICEQMALPMDGKGLAVRAVVEVLTPGTSLGSTMLQSTQANYLLAFGLSQAGYSFSCLELSTGDFKVLDTEKPWADWLANELSKWPSREILLQDSLCENSELRQIIENFSLVITRYDDWFFEQDKAQRAVTQVLGTDQLTVFGFDESGAGLEACGALLEYISQTTRHAGVHINRLERLSLNFGMSVDDASRRNLELFINSQDGSRRATLFSLLDHTKTAMGTRLLYNYMSHPLADLNAINTRLSAVAQLVVQPEIVRELRHELGQCFDIERLTSRIAMDKAHAKDLVALRQSLQQAIVCLAHSDQPYPMDLRQKVEVERVIQCLTDALQEEPQTSLAEGGVIADGYDEILDRLRALATDGMGSLEKYALTERELTGISLRLKQNRVIGWFFEVNKQQSHRLPERFLQRQATTNADRYVTIELQRLAVEIEEAKVAVIELEGRLFNELCVELKLNIQLFQAVAMRCAQLDVMVNFAHLALTNNYCRPEIGEMASGYHITEGRHPVVEQALKKQNFVPNDLNFGQGVKLLLITGPNMAGKSTYLRMNALIVFMAHLGCYVPARRALVALTDRLFCRVGSGDNLAKGQSTFLLEMTETARILHHATQASLVIIDEVGRGTGSDDGLAIAQAVMEELAYNLGVHTLFATHYHELTRITHPTISNKSLKIVETDGKIYFLNQIIDEAAQGSYGIHVAQLAGVPLDVVMRARIYFNQLVALKSLPALNSVKGREKESEQEELFSDYELLKAQLLGVNIEQITPLQSLLFLAKVQERLR
jgi:DNA mismatch repair protein MutS